MTYEDSKRRSEQRDRELGFRLDEVERTIQEIEGQQIWSSVAVQGFLTPYSEFEEIVELLKPSPGDHWIDLGAGYGRLGIVLAEKAPGVTFAGFELVKERVEEGQRIYAKLGLPQAWLVTQDLAASDFVLPHADCYFLYDYGTTAAISKTLEDLKKIAAKMPITVVARGRGVRHLIDRNHPWLGGVVAPVHRPHYSVYRSADL